jgi:hypothetical protein
VRDVTVLFGINNLGTKAERLAARTVCFLFVFGRPFLKGRRQRTPAVGHF